MAIVQISLVDDSTQEQRHELMLAITAATMQCLNVPAEKVRIIINEIPKTHFSVGGVPKSQGD